MIIKKEYNGISYEAKTHLFQPTSVELTEEAFLELLAMVTTPPMRKIGFVD